MKYQIYKFHFSTAVHIGNGNLSDGESTVCADTLFSALCHEAVKYGGQKCIDSLVKYAKNGNLIFSDMLPFIADNLYIPKPLCPVNAEQNGDSIQKKKFKKLKFIPVGKLDAYLDGILDLEDETKKIKALGKFEMRTMSSSLDVEKSRDGDMLPYSVGVYTFSKNSGLYVLAGFENTDAQKLFELLVYNLSYSGIGGKLSAGLGKYSVEKADVPNEIQQKLERKADKYVTVSTAMAAADEMEKTLENANYLLVKRTGFVSSTAYSKGTKSDFLRKKDFYSFKSGSCFVNKFVGDVFDVSNGGAHAVYRYAKPLFIGV